MLKIIKVSVLTIAITITISGCTVTKVPVEVTMPGQLKLDGISKVAIIDFNSIPNDPLTGAYCADKNTVKMTQKMIAGNFYKNKFYKVTSLDIESLIKKGHPNTAIINRFDALIYGRVWWQVSPQIKGTYPKVFTTKAWNKVKYKSGEYNGKASYSTTKVTRYTDDVLAMIPYRMWNVNLMLSLTLYRLSSQGQLEKLTEVYSVANQDFIIDNGKFKEKHQTLAFKTHKNIDVIKKLTEDGGFLEKTAKNKDLSGEFKLTQVRKTIPTTLEGKIILNEKLAKSLISKISPSKVVFNIKIDFDDEKLYELLKNRAYFAARRYIFNAALADNDFEAAERFRELEFEKACEVLVQKSDKGISAEDLADASRGMMEDKIELVYALGICEEALGDFEKALYAYRYAFKVEPQKEFALGISRCLLALGMKNRLDEQSRAKLKAQSNTKVR